MPSKEFMTKLNKHSGKWSKVRDTKRSGGMVEVEDGKYTVRISSMSLDVNDNGDPYVQFNMVVVSGPESGSAVRKRIDIAERSGEYINKSGKKEKYNITIEDCLGRIALDLQSMGVDTSDIDFGDMDSLAGELAESQPAFRVNVRTNKNGYKNVYMDKPVDGDSLPTIEDVMGSSSAEEEEVEEEESEDTEEESEEDSEEESEEVEEESEDSDEEEEYEEEEEEEDDDSPQKGAKVKAKPKGTNGPEQYVVLTVNHSAKTCTLKRSRDNRTFKDVPWSTIN